MLFKFIDSVRSKPKHVRDQYALGIAVFCTMVIGGVWSLSLPARFGAESQVAALASTTNAAPFSNFFTQLKSQFSGITKAYNALPKATTTPVTAASSTQAALDLELSEQNKQQIRASSSANTGSTIHFGSSTRSDAGPQPQNLPVVASTSNLE